MVHMSDARLSALAALALAFISTLIAFSTPYWLASDRRYYGAEFDKLGLWETCFRSIKNPYDFLYFKYYSGCRWVFSYEYSDGQTNLRDFLLPAFFVATQTLFTLGFVFLLLAAIGVLAIQLCFVIDKEMYAMRALSIIMFLSALFCTTACIIFGIKGDDRDWMPDPEHNYLSWSFALAVVGCFFQWVSSILFWVENRILVKKETKQHHSNSFDMEATSGRH
ncbi:uncharacterized protein LOC128390560 [Panonychus citri]|uniref:uncharacterized protein LOC128390560 n=1 Tax=Panonychus citri TaxID=50023 RepID=UPI002306E85C|nr:uncharacterized protein LOC128390560 [Panonychus citri]